jgi:hypothetical protein
VKKCLIQIMKFWKIILSFSSRFKDYSIQDWNIWFCYSPCLSVFAYGKDKKEIFLIDIYSILNEKEWVKRKFIRMLFQNTHFYFTQTISKTFSSLSPLSSKLASIERNYLVWVTMHDLYKICSMDMIHCICLIGEKK